jgi:hypothetical protein
VLVSISTACGPGAGTVTEATGSSTSTDAATTSLSTGTSAEPTTGAGTTGTGADTTGADTTGGTSGDEPVGACVEFTSAQVMDFGWPAQLTCGHTEVLCPSDLDVPLFNFESDPQSDPPSAEDPSRVHCLLDALRDRKVGQLEYSLSYPILGWDRGSVEIAGEFAIWRRERVDDFNSEYTERALWLESGKVFELCRAENTASAAWGCLRRYILTWPVEVECVTEPLTCE